LAILIFVYFNCVRYLILYVFLSTFSKWWSSLFCYMEIYWKIFIFFSFWRFLRQKLRQISVFFICWFIWIVFFSFWWLVVLFISYLIIWFLILNLFLSFLLIVFIWRLILIKSHQFVTKFGESYSSFFVFKEFSN